MSGCGCKACRAKAPGWGSSWGGAASAALDRSWLDWLVLTWRLLPVLFLLVAAAADAYIVSVRLVYAASLLQLAWRLLGALHH